ncbi:MAG: ABC transporter permease, partial [Chloroflexi bacterium]|nr:ABC transporter permease [Chloroflexota bacterium]
ISSQNLQSRSMVIVLGANVAKNLFPDADPIGQSIRVSRQPFKVIGVLKAKGSTGLGSQDDIALIPITTLQTRLLSQRVSRGERLVSTINIQATNEDSIDDVKQQVTELLRVRHRITGEDDFTVSSQEDTLAAVGQITNILTLFLGSIAAISLVVGGIGIMNIMLVSVTERTREIGIRKAIGARRKDILTQFLIEATVISMAGGGIGFGVGVALAMVLPNVKLGTTAINTVISMDIGVLALIVSAGIGMFFGIYPAMRAASLNPIEALRHE